MNISRFKGRRAFTLIELIVVIVILGILVAIGAFAYNNIISGTRADGSRKVAGQVGKAVMGQSALDQSTVTVALTKDVDTATAGTQYAWTASIGTANVVVNAYNNIDVIRDGWCTPVAFNTDTPGASYTVGTPVNAGTC